MLCGELQENHWWASKENGHWPTRPTRIHGQHTQFHTGTVHLRTRIVDQQSGGAMHTMVQNKSTHCCQVYITVHEAADTRKIYKNGWAKRTNIKLVIVIIESANLCATCTGGITLDPSEVTARIDIKFKSLISFANVNRHRVVTADIEKNLQWTNALYASFLWYTIEAVINRPIVKQNQRTERRTEFITFWNTRRETLHRWKTSLYRNFQISERTKNRYQTLYCTLNKSNQ